MSKHEFVEVVRTDDNNDPRVSRAESFAKAVGVPLSRSHEDGVTVIYMETGTLHPDEIRAASKRIKDTP